MGVRLTGLGRATLLLIISDTLLQGFRYAFILYLGSYSFSLLGAFLFGTAMGALLSVVVDFGINQHWIRLKVSHPALSRTAFSRVLLAKIGLSMLGMAVILGLAGAGLWRITPLPVMAGGLFLTVLQMWAETCEAIGLASRWYRLVSLFRAGLGLAMYAVPLAFGLVLTATTADVAAYAVLQASAFAGIMVLICYTWSVARSLTPSPVLMGYTELWWEARWLGMNQLAVVMDVRAPLIILGVMMGETAVGLYGLVQRTTAVVELAWASISRLLLTSYSELIGENGVQKMRAQVMHAARVTAVIMTGAAFGLWGAALLIDRIVELSSEAAMAISLLQWAVVAIGLSSVKRPFVSGLIALYRERAVCRLNMGVAAAGLILVPLLINYFGIWGPVLGWVILEAVACVLIIRLFHSVPPTFEANLEPALSQRVVL